MGLPYENEDYDEGGINGLKTDNPIHMGTDSGVISQSIGAIAIGPLAGNDTQGTSSVAIGEKAGQTTQDAFSVAIGRQAGETTQGGGCVAIGNNAGNSNQSNGNGYAVAIGWEAGQTNQGEKTFAMGVRAGNLNQGDGSFALGEQAGETGQGTSCIAIGKQAGETNQNNNTIVLNAQGTPLNTTTTNGFYVAPIANASTTNHLYYDTTTKEITYAPITINYAQHISTWGDIKIGNSITGLINENSVDAWYNLYNQQVDGHIQQLTQSITLNDATRPVKIDVTVHMIFQQTTVGFKVVCNNGITTTDVAGSRAWRQSNIASDDDTPPYNLSIIHVPNGSATVTYSVQGYLRTNLTANPFFIINPIIYPVGNGIDSTLLITEL